MVLRSAGEYALLQWTIRTHLDHELDSTTFMPLDDCFCPDQGLDLRTQSIAHQLKFAVRRDEGDCTIILESRETNTLMEFDVFHLNGFASSS